MGQFTVQQLIDQYLINIPDNNQKLITASKLREVLNSFVNSLANIYQKVQFDYYDSGKTYQNNDITLYLDVLYKKTNGIGVGITPTPSTDWSVVENPFMSDTDYGISRFATDTEAEDGTLTNVAITPNQLANFGGANYSGDEGIDVDNGLSVIKFIGQSMTIDWLDLLVTDIHFKVKTDTGDIHFDSNNKVILDAGTELQIKYNGVMPNIGEVPEQNANGIVFVKKQTEFSISYAPNETIFDDIWIRPIKITELQKTVGIDKVFISINGGLYLDIIPALPLNFPAAAEMKVKVTYNIGYNSGVVAFKGEVLN